MMEDLFLGKERLSLIHPRVKLVAKTQGYHDRQGLKLNPPCDFCEDLLNERGEEGTHWNCYPHSTDILVKCSGESWVCESQNSIINFKKVTWNKNELMTKQTHNEILKSIIRNNEVKNAMYIIEHFNMYLVNEQLHTLKATQVAVSIIYPHFIKFHTKADVLPVPLPGKEFADEWVKPHKSEECDDEYFTAVRFSNMILSKEDMVNMHGMKEIQNKLNKLRIHELNSVKEKDLLNLINTITLTIGPCNNCLWENKTLSKKMKISCTGIEELCRLKNEFFHERPQEMMTNAEAAFLLADCNIMNKYADLLNVIFNVRFVERVVELKALIDAQILCMHPHLSPVIGWYNMFILRYYHPM